MIIFAIHGAFSTPTIFNYLRLRLSKCDWRFLDYHEDVKGVDDICARAVIDRPSHVIGHSMGGLIALALAADPNVISITTVATPLDGLGVNALQAYLTRSGFINEVAYRSMFMQRLHRTKYSQPVQHLISTAGFNPYMYEDNDGVVTLKSQRGWAAGPTIEIAANHAEIMLRDETVAQLSSFISYAR